jgi:DNA-binding response OmpR family regulator
MLKLEVRQIKLKTVIDRIVQEVQPLLNEKSIDIAVSIANISVWVDEKMITRIFYNLISNAIKYSPDGGKIQINATSGNDKITIDFIDYGYGIPAKEQQLIFSRFTRGTNVNNKGISGSGIGLMISKKIIELHGGEIKLVSKENIGSKFSVILRIGSEHFATDDFAMGINDDFDTSVFDNNNEKKLILLVEDNADLRNSIKDELASKYKVITAENGKEGLLIALSKNPDLIITDVMMPKMDGKEMCRVIKSNFQTSHIPVIIVSALGEVDDKVEGIEIGADGYLEKPFNMKLLNAMALNLINSRALLKQVVGEKQQLKDVVKSPDKHFLSKVVKIIEDNLTNQKFSIDNLSDETGLSRSNLFRKLKGLTGMSPNDFVTQIKMNYAAQLLKNNKGIRISDVAYESGYNDPRYFSTLFKKFYGKTPKQFMSGGL